MDVSMSMPVHVWVCMPVCRTDVSFECASSGPVHHLLLKAWSLSGGSPIRLDWLPANPNFSPVSTFSTHLDYRLAPGFLCGSVD